MENQLKNDPGVTKKLLQYERSGTKVLRGNLLTLPLAGEMLYAQPVYTFGQGTASYPLLQFVTVALGNRVGIGKTFDQAVASALGVSQTPPPPPGDGSGGGNGGGGGGGGGSGGQTVDQRITALLAQSKAAFDQAQIALQNGDLAGYQASNAEGLRLLDQAIALREQQGTPTTGPTSPTKSSPPKSPTSPTGSSP